MVDLRQFLGMLLVPAALANARAAQSIPLPPPQLDDPATLMQAQTTAKMPMPSPTWRELKPAPRSASSSS